MKQASVIMTIPVIPTDRNVQRGIDEAKLDQKGLSILQQFKALTWEVSSTCLDAHQRDQGCKCSKLVY